MIELFLPALLVSVLIVYLSVKKLSDMFGVAKGVIVVSLVLANVIIFFSTIAFLAARDTLLLFAG